MLARLSAVLSGLLPGMEASRVDLAAAMNDGLSARGPSASRLRVEDAAAEDARIYRKSAVAAGGS